MALNASTPLDSATVTSIYFDTNTIFYWKSYAISEFGSPDIDPYIWAKVRIVTESLEITY